MNKKLQGKISRAILKFMICKKGRSFVEELMQEVGHEPLAPYIYTPRPKVMELIFTILREIGDEELAKQEAMDIPSKIEKKY